MTLLHYYYDYLKEIIHVFFCVSCYFMFNDHYTVCFLYKLYYLLCVTLTNVLRPKSLLLILIEQS